MHTMHTFIQYISCIQITVIITGRRRSQFYHNHPPTFQTISSKFELWEEVPVDLPLAARGHMRCMWASWHWTGWGVSKGTRITQKRTLCKVASFCTLRGGSECSWRDWTTDRRVSSPAEMNEADTSPKLVVNDLTLVGNAIPKALNLSPSRLVQPRITSHLTVSYNNTTEPDETSHNYKVVNGQKQPTNEGRTKYVLILQRHISPKVFIPLELCQKQTNR